MKITTEEDFLDVLRQALKVIERGEVSSLTIRYSTTSDGQDHEDTFTFDTDEERDLAVASIRKILGNLH